MSYSEQDGQVVLTISREDYAWILKACEMDCWPLLRDGRVEGRNLGY